MSSIHQRDIASKNPLTPLVYQGFTRTKEKHILHQTEHLKEEYNKIKEKVLVTKSENERLKELIEREVEKASRYVNKNREDINLREEHGEQTIKKHITKLRATNNSLAFEIQQIKKGTRFTNFNELKCETEFLEEELKRLKTICHTIRQEKNVSIMKLSDRLKQQDILLKERESKLKKMTEDVNMLQETSQKYDKDIEEVSKVEMDLLKKYNENEKEKTEKEKKVKKLEEDSGTQNDKFNKINRNEFENKIKETQTLQKTKCEKKEKIMEQEEKINNVKEEFKNKIDSEFKEIQKINDEIVSIKKKNQNSNEIQDPKINQGDYDEDSRENNISEKVKDIFQEIQMRIRLRDIKISDLKS